MNSQNGALRIALMFTVAACGEPVVPAGAELREVNLRNALTSERPGFAFLPPLASQPSALKGWFDGALAPTVTICALAGDGCGATIATFLSGGKNGVNATGNHYHVNWHTTNHAIDATATYRISVEVAGTEMGFIDVQDVEGTIPITFRIDRGAVQVVGPEGGTLHSADGRVTLGIPEDALTEPVGFTIDAAPMAPDIEVRSGIASGSVYSFGPDGSVFAGAGVDLTMTYDPARLPDGVAEEDLRLYLLHNDTLYLVPESSVDVTAKSVRGTVRHFTVYLVAGLVRAEVLSPAPPAMLVVEPQTAGTIDIGIPYQSGPPWRTFRYDVTINADKASVGEYSGLVTGLKPGGARVRFVSELDTLFVDVDVKPLRFIGITAGNLTACGLTQSRNIYCWGRNPLAVIDTNVPLRLPGSDGIRWGGVDNGFDYACAFELPPTGPVPATGGPLRCWGAYVTGQLGNGTRTAPASLPQTVGGGMHFRAVATGNEHACARQSDGSAWCWGSDQSGELGDGETGNEACTSWVFGTSAACRSSPVRVGGPGWTFSSVDAYHGFSCGVATAPTPGVYCWGNNTFGQLGDGTTTASSMPVAVDMTDVPPGVTFRSVVTGQFHACALANNAHAYCWGTNFFNVLGLGPAAPPDMCGPNPCAKRPQVVHGSFFFRAITAGRDHTCGILAGAGAQDVYCWGSNEWGQSGHNLVHVHHATPTLALGGFKFLDIEAGRQSTCGIAPTAGTNIAFCWGLGNWGQLGNGTGKAGLGPSTFITQALLLQGF